MNKVQETFPAENIIKNLLPPLALLAAVILWGGSFAASRVVLRSFNPMALMWSRMIFALVIVLPFAGKLKDCDYIKGDWKWLFPMVLFQPCLYFLLESNALNFTTSTQAGVISASVPVLVTVGAWLFLSEKINRLTAAGLVISVSGVILLTIIQDESSIAANPVLGNIMEFTAMIFAASNMLIIKKMSKRYNPWSLTAMQVIAGSLFFLPGLFSLIQMGKSVWTLELILILIYLGVFVSLGAFGLYNWGISRIAASKASSYINLVPVTAILFGWILLGEKLNFFQSISAVIVLSGVIMIQKSQK